MDTREHRRRGSGRSCRRLTTTLAVLKATALGSLLTLVVAGGLHTSDVAATRGGAATGASDAYGRVAARAALGQRCSADGVGGSSSGSALIRTEGGQVRSVSFETGWDVLNGKRPGRLIAICVD